jgi:hypothetical protein
MIYSISKQSLTSPKAPGEQMAPFLSYLYLRSSLTTLWKIMMPNEEA